MEAVVIESEVRCPPNQAGVHESGSSMLNLMLHHFILNNLTCFSKHQRNNALLNFDHVRSPTDMWVYWANFTQFIWSLRGMQDRFFSDRNIAIFFLLNKGWHRSQKWSAFFTFVGKTDIKTSHVTRPISTFSVSMWLDFLNKIWN